jgi:alpha-galactosidase
MPVGKLAEKNPAAEVTNTKDALTYAKWGVDYLKYDWCNTEKLNAEGAYLTMRDALYAAGRPIVFSLCEWGNNKPWEWGKKIGHLWRTTGDIIDCFSCVVDHGTWKSWGIMQIVDKQDGLRIHAGPDHWNDPDMMEVGNAMSVNEDRAHFSMWAMLAAPLIAGNDLRNMSKETIEILTNKEVIAVDQDVLGIQGFRFIEDEGLETWFKPLDKDEWAVCFLNRREEPAKINFAWKEHWVDDSFSHKKTDFANITYSIRDLWKKADAGKTDVNFVATVPSHDVVMLRLTPL